jgi:hypothetical protein
VNFADSLHDHLSNIPTAPFLFVGSGFSRRYAGSEDWSGMLATFAEKTGKPYARYFSSANGNLPAVASLIAEDFHDIWWDSPEFEASRAAYPSPLTRFSPLKIEVAVHFGKSIGLLPQDGELNAELEALRDAVLEGVITTNYDGILEYVFPDFTTYIGQDELLFRDPQGVAEIYKIHGSYTHPDSLVLTTADYERFAARNPYLAAKLLTVFVEHPIFFLGYSLSDTYILDIITSIARVLTTENLGELKDRLLFVQWDASISEPKMVESTISADGVPIPIHLLTVPSYMELFEVLGGLERRFPARILRHLKKQVYELVRTSTPSKSVVVSDLESDVDASTVDVVIGVGVAKTLADKGITGMKRRDLLLDVLDPKIDSAQHAHVVHNLLPTVLSGKTHAPVMRYLRGASLLDGSGSLVKGAQLDPRVRARYRLGVAPLQPKDDYYTRKVARILQDAPDLEALTKIPVRDALLAIPSLPVGQVDSGLLRSYLIAHKGLLDSANVFEATAWVKAVCFYDIVANQLAPAPVTKNRRRK